MSKTTQIAFDFGQTAQSVLMDYFTLPKGKISFAGQDFFVYRADGRKAPTLSRPDFIAAGRRCAEAYAKHLKEGGEPDIQVQHEIIKAEMAALAGEPK